jgi:hypothetical protein
LNYHNEKDWQMTDINNKARGWSNVRQQLASWDRSALVALIKDLYETASVNRDFIHARCQAGENGGQSLEVYRSKIIEQFFPARGYGNLKLGQARQAIREYRKASGNLAGVIELLMTYVENGVKYTHKYGDIDERFYNSIESCLNELTELLQGKARSFYPQYVDRLTKLIDLSDGIGWGFHDFIEETIDSLEEQMDNSQDR